MRHERRDTRKVFAGCIIRYWTTSRIIIAWTRKAILSEEQPAACCEVDIMTEYQKSQIITERTEYLCELAGPNVTQTLLSYLVARTKSNIIFGWAESSAGI